LLKEWKLKIWKKKILKKHKAYCWNIHYLCKKCHVIINNWNHYRLIDYDEPRRTCYKCLNMKLCDSCEYPCYEDESFDHWERCEQCTKSCRGCDDEYCKECNKKKKIKTSRSNSRPQSILF